MVELADQTARILDLEQQLAEANDTLSAIQQGGVDALVLQSGDGPRVYTLDTADRPYRMLIEQMREGAVTLSSAGDVLYCNQYLAALLGRPLELVTGHRLHRFATPAGALMLDALIRGAHGEDGAELCLLRADGREIPVKLSIASLPREPGSPQLFCASITDLTQITQRNRDLAEATQRLQAEMAVRQHAERDRQRLAALVEESPDFIALMRPDSTLLYVNAAGRRMAGLMPGDAPEQSILGFLMAAERARMSSHVLPAVLRRGRWSGDMQLQNRSTNQPVMVMQDVFILEQDGDGPSILATIARDVSEQRRIEGQLRQAQKMEAVGQLTGGIAHDFNNLLTGILGSLELMRTRVAQGRYDALDRYAAAAAASATRAAAMTQRLLAFSRRQPLTLRAVDVGQLAASMADLLRRTAGPEIALQLDADPALWPTLCDANQLENVLLNLVLNARDAMRDGGRITLSCRNVTLATDAQPLLRDITPGDYLAIQVGDTGAGMDANTVARAFDPFFTTKPIGQGTGLGLSMVYGFANQSGGHARLSSTVGVGTTVSVYLPRSLIEPEPEIVPAAAAEGWAATHDQTVLIVEDEAPVRILVAELLTEVGLTVMEATDGLKGLAAIQSDARIDLLITDVGLPGMNGRQLASAARAARPDIRVLFMTGYAEDPVFGRHERDSRVAMITKPFSVGTFTAAVRGLLLADG